MVRHEKSQGKIAAVAPGKDKSVLVFVMRSQFAHGRRRHFRCIKHDRCRIASARAMTEHVYDEDISISVGAQHRSTLTETPIDCASGRAFECNSSVYDGSCRAGCEAPVAAHVEG